MKEQYMSYRLLNDVEPDEEALSALMHEVALEAEEKSIVANRELRSTIKRQISEALAREGF